MQIKKMTPFTVTEKLNETRDFYLKHFDFRVTFEAPDCCIGLKSNQNADVEIMVMKPCPDGKPYGGEGVSLCFEVDDVDAEFARLNEAGVPMVMAVQDNPWGDRSFTAVDPAGVSVYVYKPIEPTDEYKAYFKE